MNLKSSTLTLLLTCIGIGLSTIVACADSHPCNNKEYQQWNAPDSATHAILGNRLTELLMNPKKVEMYNVVFQDSLHRNNPLVEPDFVIDTMICKLDKEQIATLNFILLSDSNNYLTDTLAIPMIPHRPAYVFNFNSKKENALIWYSPGDFTWGIRYDGRNLFYYNVASPETINRFCKNLIIYKTNN